MEEEYMAKHFALSLPKGANQDNVSRLLAHLSETLTKEFPDADIMDITFHDEIDGDGNSWPSFSVYYR